jgi:hypothetical protein
MRGMANVPRRSSDQFLMRVAVGVLLVIVAIMLLNWVLGFLFGLIRIALLLGLLAVVAWFVLIGPPGSDE